MGIVGCRSGAGRPAGRRYKSAGSRLFIHNTTVSRKLPTMIPTDVIMAIAVERAPTNTDVRRNDAARLCEASKVSTPRVLHRARDERERSTAVIAGIASAEAATRKSAETYPSNGLPSIGLANASAVAAAARPSAMQRSRAL